MDLLIEPVCTNVLHNLVGTIPTISRMNETTLHPLAEVRLDPVNQLLHLHAVLPPSHIYTAWIQQICYQQASVLTAQDN